MYYHDISLTFCYHDHEAVLLLILGNEIAAAPAEPEESETEIHEPDIYSMLNNYCDKVCISHRKLIAAPPNPIQTRPDDGTCRSTWTRTEKFGKSSVHDIWPCPNKGKSSPGTTAAQIQKCH